MGTDELLVNVILRRELGWAREVPKRTWLFLLHRHCVMTPHDMKGYTEDMELSPKVGDGLIFQAAAVAF